MNALDILLSLRQNAKLEIEHSTSFAYTVNYREGESGKSGFACGGQTLAKAMAEAEKIAAQYIEDVTS